MSRFEWQNRETIYREVRPSHDADELRWILNRETIHDNATGVTTTRGTIRHPGVCVIVQFLDRARILLIRQYRYAAGKELWELPAGTMKGRIEKGRMTPAEAPEDCARRELLEETGYEADSLRQVCQCYAIPGTSDELMRIFFAENLTKRQQSLDAGEVIEEVKPFSLTEISGLIEKAAIHDAKTLVGLFYALRSSTA